MNSQLRRVELEGITLFHTVDLGSDVATNLVRLVRIYAAQAGLKEIPPVTCGPSTMWGRPWERFRDGKAFKVSPGLQMRNFGRGVTITAACGLTSSNYPTPRSRIPITRRNIEATIAHEIAHLRWWNLRHGPEFSARVLALLRGAVFPGSGGWSLATRKIMQETRAETDAYWRRKLSGAVSRES